MLGDKIGGQNVTLWSSGVRQSGVSDRGRLQGHGSGDPSITTHPLFKNVQQSPTKLRASEAPPHSVFICFHCRVLEGLKKKK